MLSTFKKKKNNNCHLDVVNICREDINFPVRGSLSTWLHPLWLFFPPLTSVHRRVPGGLVAGQLTGHGDPCLQSVGCLLCHQNKLLAN